MIDTLNNMYASQNNYTERKKLLKKSNLVIQNLRKSKVIFSDRKQVIGCLWTAQGTRWEDYRMIIRGFKNITPLTSIHMFICISICVCVYIFFKHFILGNFSFIRMM